MAPAKQRKCIAVFCAIAHNAAAKISLSLPRVDGCHRPVHDGASERRVVGRYISHYRSSASCRSRATLNLPLRLGLALGVEVERD